MGTTARGTMGYGMHGKTMVRSAVVMAVCMLATGAPEVFAASSPTGRTPKLFWSSQRQDLWNQMRAANHPWWQEIKANADLSGTSSARYADLGQWAAMAYQVTGSSTYAAKAWAEASPMLKGAAKPDSSRNFTREHFIEFVWMYDWLYPGLTAAQRSQWITSLNYWADLCLDQTSESWGTRLSDSDETTGHYFGLVLWDLASAADNSRAGQFLAHSKVGGLDQTSTSRNTMRNAVSDYIRRSEGGQWIESTKYNMGTLQLLLMGTEGVRTATGTEKFPEIAAFRRDVALGQIHEVTPDLKQAFQWGDNEEPRSLNRDRRVSLASILAGLLEGDPIGPAVKNFRDAIQGGEDPEFRWMLLGNPYAASADFRGVIARGHIAPGVGALFYRDGTASSRSLFASHLSVRSTVDHETHYFANFDLYRGGEFAVTHVIGYDANEGEHHNSMLLAGLSVMDEARGPVAEEVGADYAYHAGSTGGNRYKNGYYNPPPRYLHEWTRSLLYLPSTDQQHDTVVVFDRVNAEDPETLVKLDKYSSSDRSRITNAPALKQWVLHAPSAPTLNAGSITWQTSGGQAIRVSTLLPSAQTRTVYDEDVLNLKGTMQTSERRHQVRIIPAASQRWDAFLNVIQASAPGVSLSNTLVTSVAGGATGVVIKRPNHPNVVALFNAAQGPDLPPTATSNGYLQTDYGLLSRLNANRLHANGYTVTFASDTSSTVAYLADLDPAKSWRITVDGLAETVLAVSPQGLARITVSGTGSHTLVVRVAGAATDTTAPVISAVQAANITDIGAVITWTTNEPATSQVEYGTTTAYGQTTPLDGALGTSHAVTLAGLSASTLYHARVRSNDGAGNPAVSSDATFTTASATQPPPPPTGQGFLESGGQVVMEAEHADVNTPRNGKTWTPATAAGGFSGGGYLTAAANTGMSINTGYETSSPEVAFDVTFATPGTYYVWVRGRAEAADGSNDSLHAGMDGAGQASSDRMDGYNTTSWVWKNQTLDGVPSTVVIAAPGVHTIHVWMREDGMCVDKVLLRTNSSSTAPSGTGPAESPRGSGTPVPNQPPVLGAIGAKQITEGQTLAFSVTASDPDGGALTYSASGLPAGASFSGQTFSWTPGSTQAGLYTVTISVSDGSLTDAEAVVITVLEPATVNTAPVADAGADQTIVMPTQARLSASATDDGLPSGTLTYAWTTVSGPGTVTISNPTSRTPGATFSAAGSYVLRFTADDGALTDSDELTVTVQPASTLPLITGISVTTGRTLSTGTTAIGGPVYVDRSYTFTSVPAEYLGQPYIRMANDDKNVNKNPYLTFTLNAPAVVYVAFDDRSTVLPTWLGKSSWFDTGEQLVTSDATFRIYQKPFAAGEVQLGSNRMWPERGSKSHYIVIVVPE